jgi:hypothetical protein
MDDTKPTFAEATADKYEYNNDTSYEECEDQEDCANIWSDPLVEFQPSDKLWRKIIGKYQEIAIRISPAAIEDFIKFNMIHLSNPPTEEDMVYLAHRIVSDIEWYLDQHRWEWIRKHVRMGLSYNGKSRAVNREEFARILRERNRSHNPADTRR